MEYIVNKNFFPENLFDALIEYSNNPADLEVRRDDDHVRFKDIPTLQKWLQRERTFYVLTDPQRAQLLGISWFRREPMPPEEGFTYDAPLDKNLYNYTTAVRLYKGLRGAGKGREILQKTLGDFIESAPPDAAGIWARTAHPGSMKIRSSLGFRAVSSPKVDLSVRSLPQNNPRVVYVATMQEIAAALKQPRPNI